MKELKGKTAIITGASKGIGAATARRMGELGVNVVLAARSEKIVKNLAEELSSEGFRASGIGCDVANYLQVKAVTELAKSKYGSIDILVNNAGVIEPIARITDSNPADWSHAVDVNVKGVYHFMHTSLPYMLRQKSGVIINISSGAATSALEGWSHYCSSKAAALSLTHCAHKEVAEKGVRIIGLSPGTVATDMQTAIRASGINPVSQLNPAVHIPPEWVAEAVCWMATKDASQFDGDDVSLRNEAIRQRIGLE